MATTILVVDGYEMVRTALRQWLEVEFPSATVVEAISGTEAIKRIRFQVPSLVIIDVLMPGSIGINATRKIRDALPLVPIMILTMYEDEEYRADMLNAGANVFLPKRQMHTKLIPRLRTMLDAAHV
jgi:DNA-binding NarL/FixJ family response regulator